MRLPVEALKASFDYLTRNPFEILRAARHAAGLRVSIPLDAVRWLLGKLPPNKKMPQDLALASADPGLNVKSTVNLMGTKLRTSADIRFDEVRLSPEAIRLELRLSNVALEPIGDNTQGSPIVAFLKSGALDLTKPGNLVGMLPMKVPAIIEASGDRIVLDLLKMPKLAANPVLRKLLEVIAPVFTLRSIETLDDHLVVTWRPRPSGLTKALSKLVVARGG